MSLSLSNIKRRRWWRSKDYGPWKDGSMSAFVWFHHEQHILLLLLNINSPDHWTTDVSGHQHWSPSCSGLSLYNPLSSSFNEMVLCQCLPHLSSLTPDFSYCALILNSSGILATKVQPHGRFSFSSFLSLAIKIFHAELPFIVHLNI